MNDGEIRALQEIMDRSRRIVFFGGAGVSTASGIPDFRSAEGLYAEEEDGLSPEMILSKSFFYLQPERFFDYYRRHLLYPEAKPNAAHRKLFELEQADKLRGIVTQNVDGLHKAAGNIRAAYPMDAILNSEGIPRCRECGGVIKPNVTLYGEPLEKYVCIGAIREITNADTLIVAGTSLAVEPAASFISHFRGKNLVILNRSPIPAEEQATLVIHGDVAEIMDRIRCG